MTSLSNMPVRFTTPKTAETIRLADQTIADTNRVLSRHASTTPAQKDTTTMTIETTPGPSLYDIARQLADRTGRPLADCQAEAYAAARRAASDRKPMEASNAAVLGDDVPTVSASVEQMGLAIANAECISYEEGLAKAKKIAAAIRANAA